MLQQHRLDLFRNIVLPTKQKFGHDIFAYIKPKSEYVALSEDYQKYVRISATDLINCKHLSGQYICDHTSTVFNINKDTTCEIRIISDNEFKELSKCNIKMTTLNDGYWKQLSNGYSWLYSLPRKEQINILCKNNTAYHVYLEDTGILTLNPECKASTLTVTLTPITEITTHMNTTYMSHTNLQISELINNLTNTPRQEILNDIITQLENKRNQETIDDDATEELEFQKIIEKANEISNNIKIKNSSEDKNDSSLSIFGYFGAVTGSAGIMWCLLKQAPCLSKIGILSTFCNLCKNGQNTRNSTREEQQDTTTPPIIIQYTAHPSTSSSPPPYINMSPNFKKKLTDLPTQLQKSRKLTPGNLY